MADPKNTMSHFAKEPEPKHRPEPTAAKPGQQPMSQTTEEAETYRIQEILYQLRLTGDHWPRGLVQSINEQEKIRLFDALLR
jgi:hypothetical protein